MTGTGTTRTADDKLVVRRGAAAVKQRVRTASVVGC